MDLQLNLHKVLYHSCFLNQFFLNCMIYACGFPHRRDLNINLTKIILLTNLIVVDDCLKLLLESETNQIPNNIDNTTACLNRGSNRLKYFSNIYDRNLYNTFR